MKQVDKMPTEGQFVVIWKENGKLMSETRAWFRGDLMALSCVDDSFVYWDDNDYPDDAKFFIEDQPAYAGFLF